MSIIKQKYVQGKKQVLSMEEVSKRKIVEHNDLISSVAKMDKIPLKIFELVVSCIDTENPPKDNLIYLSKKEMFNLFDVSDSNKHTRFKNAVQSMQKQAYFDIREKTGRGLKYRSIVPIPTVSWNSYEDTVSIRLNPDIMPYLIDLKQNFTQYALSDVIELESKYSIILYKWLCMNYNQYEHYNYKGGRREEQLNQYQNPIISIKELREMTDTVDDYSRFGNFETRVIKKAVSEINEFTHFIVNYEKMKKGVQIESIQFFITKKRVAPSNYKEEQQDPEYLKGKEEKERKKQELFAKGMQSRYTTLLLEKMLLGYKDMQNVDTIADLQSRVYPLYDELKNMGGMNAVEEHISYIKNHEEPYSKTNISKYLYKCADGWVHVGAKRKYQ